MTTKTYRLLDSDGSIYESRQLGQLGGNSKARIYGQFTYKFGGGDQICVIVDGIENAELLVSVPAFREAIRLFNYRLMKKKPCNWKQNHCMALADALFKRMVLC